MSKHKASSDSYQYRIVEVGIDPHHLLRFADADGIAAKLEQVELDPVIQDYRNRLIEELRKLINSQLTTHQKTVLTLTFEGFTQNEIAKKLGITQSAVHKALTGNIDYANGGKRYGGAVQKLRRACENHLPVLQLLNDLENYKRARFDLPPKPLVMPTKKVRAYHKKRKKIRDDNGKHCYRCKKYKTWTNYYKDRCRKDGYNGKCIACCKK